MFALRKRSGYVLAALFCTLAVVGCRKGTLTGSVTYKGQPVTSGTVTLYDEEGKAYQGEITEEGNYTIENIPPGTARLTVSSPDPKAGLKAPKDADKEAAGKMGQHNAEQKGKGPGAKGWRKIPDKYTELSNSGLTFDVKRGANSYDIPLTD